jgi:uncharacterized OB-fold protein
MVSQERITGTGFIHDVYFVVALVKFKEEERILVCRLQRRRI